jgi:hypothetical protein
MNVPRSQSRQLCKLLAHSLQEDMHPLLQHILTLSQPVFVLTPKCFILGREAANTSFKSLFYSMKPPRHFQIKYINCSSALNKHAQFQSSLHLVYGFLDSKHEPKNNPSCINFYSFTFCFRSCFAGECCCEDSLSRPNPAYQCQRKDNK